MKTIAFALLLLATAPVQAQATYEQLMNVKFTDRSCSMIDQWVTWTETQLRLKGLLGVDPEKMSNEDRLYNVRARSIIWALRIGCSNPDRYK